MKKYYIGFVNQHDDYHIAHEDDDLQKIFSIYLSLDASENKTLIELMETSESSEESDFTLASTELLGDKSERYITDMRLVEMLRKGTK